MSVDDDFERAVQEDRDRACNRCGRVDRHRDDIGPLRLCTPCATAVHASLTEGGTL